MAIGLSHGGSTIYSSPSPSNEVLVATLDGVVTLARTAGRPGTGWKVANRALVGSHISSIITPEPDLILAGIFGGGIMASHDDGHSWERQDSGVAHRDVYSLAATRLNGRLKLFAGTEPAHCYVSDDRGASWHEMPALRTMPSLPRWTFPQAPHVAHLKYIAVAPDDPATIFACVEQGGMFQSTDAGETWRELGGFHDDVHRMLINPRDSRRMYMMTGVGLFVSEDGGDTWQQRTGADSVVGGYPDQLVFVPSQPELMFAGGAKSNPGQWFATGFAGSRISRSRDGARSWEILGNGLPTPEQWQSSIEAMCLEDWGASFSIFAATTSGEVFATDDGARSWSLIAGGLAPISKGGHYRPLHKAA